MAYMSQHLSLEKIIKIIANLLLRIQHRLKPNSYKYPYMKKTMGPLVISAKLSIFQQDKILVILG